MMGSQGLQAVLSGNTPSYLEDGTPANETTYHARFYFDPNSTATGGAATYLLTGLNTKGKIVFRVQYRKNGTKYQVRAGALLKSGSQALTNWYNITDGPHVLEIAWQGASGAAFTFFIDGAAAQTLTNIDTSSYLLDRVRLGPSGGLTSSTIGTEFFDGFVSTRSTYIGP